MLMLRLLIKYGVVLSILLTGTAGCGQTGELETLFKQVANLKLERQGYILGSKLSKAQLKIASENPEKVTAQGTFKFRDKNLHIVAHKTSNRVVVIYEQFEKAEPDKVKQVIGDLYLTFEDPTVMAHDKIIYWAWVKDGKLSSRKFDAAKKDKKKLDILATVKCISDVGIMEKKDTAKTGELYYIISSDPILKFFSGTDT